MKTSRDIATASLAPRYLLASVGGQDLAFPDAWVSDIVAVERSQLLPLPFYSPSVLGVISHEGKILPLVSALAFFPELPQPSWHQSILMAIRLKDVLGSLAGVGLAVERIAQNVTAGQLTTERILRREELPDSLWQPQRWHLSH